MSYACRTCREPYETPKARASHERVHSGPTLAERFWSKVDRSGGLWECWLWTGSRNPKGYGRITVSGRSVAASRVALSLVLCRPLSPGMLACHSCDNPPCVNPAHLFEAPDAENNADRHRKDRDAVGARNGRARLTEARVRSMREMQTSGMGPTAISETTGVPIPTVKHVLARRTWQHVP